MYKLTQNPDAVISLDTNTFIPAGHYMWNGYQSWLAAGNIPEPADVIVTSQITSVTMRQARLQLLSMGKLTIVSDAISALTGDVGAKAQIEWEYASTIDMSDPTTLAIITMLSFSVDEVNAFFTAASLL